MYKSLFYLINIIRITVNITWIINLSKIKSTSLRYYISEILCQEFICEYGYLSKYLLRDQM